MPSTSRYLLCAGREIHFTEWGLQHEDGVIAWHGLALIHTQIGTYGTPQKCRFAPE
jgi:hypothetical protein